jgi:phage terminase small subunit
VGKRGPSRLPTNVVKLRGQAGHTRPINDDEPQFQGEIVIPDHIKAKPGALAEWERRAPELEELGLLNGQFQTEFADYCMQHAYYLEHQKDIETFGMRSAVAAGIWKAFQTASVNRQRLASKFGFDPADSSSIKVQAKGNHKEKDKEKRFFG